MREQDHKPDLPNGSEDDLDRVLNSALAVYATVEARAGLEERVLARFRAEQSVERRIWWSWGFAAAILVLLIVVVAWHSSGETRARIAKQIARPAVVKPVESGNVRRPDIRIASPIRGVKTAKHQARRPVNPKLDQFPSPHPLSEQEQILAMYISQDPERAALIAEARMQTLRQDEAEKIRLASEDAREIGR